MNPIRIQDRQVEQDRDRRLGLARDRESLRRQLRPDGVELGTIRDLMGHASTRMTERYAHIAPGHLHEAVRRISRTGTATGTSSTTEVATDRATGANRAAS